MVGFTERAVEALTRSVDAARRFNPDAWVRLSLDGAGVLRAELTDQAFPGDETVQHAGGFDVLVAEGVEGTVDAGEHDALILLAGP